MTKYQIVIGLAILVLTSCGSIKRTDTDFRYVTANQVGVKPQEVKILSSEGGHIPVRTLLTGEVEGFKWTAKTSKGNYNCEGDVNLDRVICDPAN